MERNTALFWLLAAAALIAAVNSHSTHGHSGEEEEENAAQHNESDHSTYDNKYYILTHVGNEDIITTETNETHAGDHPRADYAIDEVYFKHIEDNTNTDFTAADPSPLLFTNFNVSWPTTIVIGDYPSLLESIMVVVAHWRTLKQKPNSNLIVVGWGGRDVFPRGHPSNTAARKRQDGSFPGTGGGGPPPGGIEYPGTPPEDRERIEYQFEMPDYMPLVAQIEPTAAKVSEMLNALVASRGLNLTTTVLMAHGLGCHIAGHVGRLFQNLKMIVAIEPARAIFKEQFKKTPDIYNGLKATDGNVFVIHGQKTRYGFRNRLGDTDLYLHFKEKTGYYNYCHYIYSAYAIGAALLSDAALPSLMHGFLCDSEEFMKKGLCMDPATAITLTYDWDDIKPGMYFAQLNYNVDTDITVAITPNFDAVFPHYNCEYDYMFPSPTTVIKVTSDTVDPAGTVYIDAALEVNLGQHYTNTTITNVVSNRNKKLGIDTDRMFVPLGSLRSSNFYPDIKVILMARNVRPKGGSIHVNKLTFELIGEISGQIDTYMWCNQDMIEWEKYFVTLKRGVTCP